MKNYLHQVGLSNVLKIQGSRSNSNLLRYVYIGKQTKLLKFPYWKYFPCINRNYTITHFPSLTQITCFKSICKYACYKNKRILYTTLIIKENAHFPGISTMLKVKLVGAKIANLWLRRVKVAWLREWSAGELQGSCRYRKRHKNAL